MPLGPEVLTNGASDIAAYLCEHCAKHADLKRYIRKAGVVGRQCCICMRRNRKSVDLESDPNGRSLLKALIRLCYSQWDYDSEFGGERFETLLSRENPIVSHHYADAADQEQWSETVNSLTWPSNEPADKGVSLFYDGLVKRLSDTTSPAFRRWASDLQNRNYYQVEPDARQVLEGVAARITRRIVQGTEFFRVRIGTKTRFVTNVDDFESVEHHVPHQDAAVSAPPPRLSGFGRANRQGVSFLYVASDRSTAIAETRPHPGHAVSVGVFSNTRDLNVADFSTVDFLEFFQTDDLLDQYVLLKTIDRELSTPVIPEEQHRYTVTQLIVDILRQLGFDGVAYRSSVGTGTNFAFFNPEDFAYVPSGASVVRIEAVRYKVADVPFKLELEDDDFEIR